MFPGNAKVVGVMDYILKQYHFGTAYSSFMSKFQILNPQKVTGKYLIFSVRTSVLYPFDLADLDAISEEKLLKSSQCPSIHKSSFLSSKQLNL